MSSAEGEDILSPKRNATIVNSDEKSNGLLQPSSWCSSTDFLASRPFGIDEGRRYCLCIAQTSLLEGRFPSSKISEMLIMSKRFVVEKI